MICLCRCCLSVALVCRGLFPCGRAGADSTSSAVVTHMIERGVVDDGLVVNIVNIRDVYVIHRAVVVETAVIPISALIADATVAEAIVDAAVKADIGAPIAFIPGKGVAAPTPITRRPEKADLGS